MGEAIPDQLCSDILSDRKRNSSQCIICLGFNIVYTKDIKPLALKDTLLIHLDDEASSSSHSSSSSSSRSLSSEKTSFVDVKRKICSSHNQISKGLLQCFSKNGHPYFVFYILNERNEEEVGFLVANQAKKHNPPYDCVYSFHSRSYFPKEGGRNSCSSIVGEMKVTCCVTFGSNGTIVTEREFVLHGIRDEHHHQQQRNALNTVKFKGLSNLFKSQHPNPIAGGDVDIDFDDSVEESWLNNRKMDLELAAVVIKDTKKNTKKENMGGWGLKFLEKSIAATKHVEPSLKEGSARCVNVVLPAGIHGGKGQSSLVERWATGGHCNCGGWDIGCPLTVLNNKTSSGKDSTAVILFQEGAKKQGEPTLRLVPEQKQQGLYHVYFQSSLTSLHAFSIGVAILHNQIPDLCPKVVDLFSTPTYQELTTECGEIEGRMVSVTSGGGGLKIETSISSCTKQ